ncbi:MAG: hypothetical protein JO217_07120 [Acidobacteriaceae bacterium]|nr:hypothetical protein [Acidobacteriaceae bacterium]
MAFIRIERLLATILNVKKSAYILLFSLCQLLVASPVFAWGAKGHRIVAIIAQNHIQASTKAQIARLLGEETLVTISTWPDEIRKDRDETSGWHYVDIPKAAAFFDNERDCYQPYSNHKNSDVDHQNCVVDRIDYFARIVSDTSQPKEKRVEALKFLVHFVGDIHQPMHAIEEAAGGNGIKVTLFGNATCGEEHPCNLHGVWDSGLIDHTGLDEAAYAEKLQREIEAGNLSHRIEGRPADWANESHRIAEGALVEQNGVIDELYFQHEISVLDEQLAVAGLRLAHILDVALGNSGTN